MRIGELHRCAIACSSSGRAECRCSMVPNVTRATVRNTRAHRHFGTRLSPRFASPPFWSSLSLSLSLCLFTLLTSSSLLLSQQPAVKGAKMLFPPFYFFIRTLDFSLSLALSCARVCFVNTHSYSPDARVYLAF